MSELKIVTADDSSEVNRDPRALTAWKICTDYLRATLTRPDLATYSWRRGEHSYTSAELALRVWREASEYPTQLFQVTLSEMLDRLRDAHLAKVRAQLLNDDTPAGALGELNRFVRLLAHPSASAEEIEYYTLAWRQLIWQIKRRLRGLPTYWDIMLVLVGAQGSGKSSAVAQFARPLDLLWMEDADFSIFSDSFRIVALNRFFLIRLDELGQATRTDIEKVKQRITSQKVQARAMRSETERRLDRNASFIGTSNHSISDSLSDATGMRRFVEMRCTDAEWTVEYGDHLKALDWHLIWACETGNDEDAPLASKTARPLVTSQQALLRVPTEFELFAGDMLEVTGEREDVLSNAAAYRAYSVQWGGATRRMAIQKFSAHMKKMCPDIVRPGNAVHYRGVRLKPEFDT